MAPRKSTTPIPSAETQVPRGTRKKISLQELQREIEKRAYEISIERHAQGQHGDDLSNWLQAEAEVKAKYGL